MPRTSTEQPLDWARCGTEAQAQAHRAAGARNPAPHASPRKPAPTPTANKEGETVD